MSTATRPPDVGTTLFLLTIRGKFKGKTLDEARQAHNGSAGLPQSIDAARALGDLSHAVYVRADEAPKDGAIEGLFLDIWNSATGLNQFFGNPQVQEGGKHTWAEFAPTLWTSVPGFAHVQLPPPRSKNERAIGLIRGTVKSMDDARKTLEASIVNGVNTARRMGLLSREYFVPAEPAKRDSKEILGMDVWTGMDGMKEFYSQHEDAAVFQIYSGKPDTSMWTRPPGDWTEW